ncbi:MAG: YedE family putative selenium transporter [bacterium]|nr:YedE family putative selenium transporter [bacterium]
MGKIKISWMVFLTGGLLGVLFAFLISLGNPPNMGVCGICFIRDIAGALGLHHMEKLSYIRPEILGFILGAFIIGIFTKEFKVIGGSSPIIRFTISFFVAMGALVFLGCPIRMLGRLAGGDWTALAGLLGFIVGIWIGTLFLKGGFTLGKAQEVSKINGFIIPVIALILFILLLAKPSFLVLTPKGHAPIVIAIIAGLLIGIFAQRARLCFAGGIRDIFLMKDFHLFSGILGFFLFCFMGNLLLGQFKPGVSPGVHTNYIASFLGMLLVGWGSVLIGGCPFRQTILAGYGNTDSGISFLGMVAGVAVAHNFMIAGSAAGVLSNGIIAMIIGIGVFFIIGLSNKVVSS